MEWTRSDTLALAALDCTRCQGMGLRELTRGKDQPCQCVFRSIFRKCFARFRQCVTKEKCFSHATLEYSPRGGRRITWARKDEEYIADFLLVSKRYLTPEEHRLFRAHFLLGADWRLCCRQFKIDRGTFFHEIYRIQNHLGRVYRELKPYALYPLDEYFGGRTENTVPSSLEDIRRVIPIRRRNNLSDRLDVPIRKVA